MTVARAPCRPARGAPGRPAHRPDRARLARGPRARLGHADGPAEGLRGLERAGGERGGSGEALGRRSWLARDRLHRRRLCSRRSVACTLRHSRSAFICTCVPSMSNESQLFHVSRRASRRISHRVAHRLIHHILPPTTFYLFDILGNNKGNKQGVRRCSACVRHASAACAATDVNVLTPCV